MADRGLVRNANLGLVRKDVQPAKIGWPEPKKTAGERKKTNYWSGWTVWKGH